MIISCTALARPKLRKLLIKTRFGMQIYAFMNTFSARIYRGRTMMQFKKFFYVITIFSLGLFKNTKIDHWLQVRNERLQRFFLFKLILIFWPLTSFFS